MAYRRRRRSSYRRSSGPVSRRQLNVVRWHGALDLDEDNNMRTLDMFQGAQGDGWYGKDLTPCTVVGVSGSFTWWTEATTTATQGTLGVGLIGDSKRQVGAIQAAGDEEIEAQLSPLDLYGRYQRWHYRRVVPVITESGSGYEASQQAADNRMGIRVKSNRKLHTVDDTYWAVVDTQDMAGNTVHFWYDLTIWLREP